MATLTELKAKATDLGLTSDDVKQYGSLSKKTTWLLAIDNHIVETITEIANESPATESTTPEQKTIIGVVNTLTHQIDYIKDELKGEYCYKIFSKSMCQYLRKNNVSDLTFDKLKTATQYLNDLVSDNDPISDSDITELKEIDNFVSEVMGTELNDPDNVADRLIDVLEELTKLEQVTGDNPFKDNDKWLEDTAQSENGGGTAYLYETKDYAVVDNTIYEGFNCVGYTFKLKPNTIVYNTKTCHPLWIAQFDDAKKTCDDLQAKFDQDVKIAVDNHVPDTETLPDDYLADDDIYILIDGEKVLASEVVPTANLLTLQKTDDRFKYYQPWMIPGSIFYTGDQQYEILYFDRYGNCHAKGSDQSWHSFRIESIGNTRLYNWNEVSNNVSVKPTLSMLYKPTQIVRSTRLKNKGSTGKFRQMNVIYDRSFIVWKLANILSEFGAKDEHLLKGLFDDVLTQIKTNEHNNELFSVALGWKKTIDDDEQI